MEFVCPVRRFFGFHRIACAALVGAAVFLTFDHNAAAAPGDPITGGCAAVNSGAFNVSLSGRGNSSTATVTGFAAGDRITHTIGATVAAGGNAQWWIKGGSTLVDSVSTDVDMATISRTYTMTAADGGSLSQTARLQGDDVPQTITVTATCVPATGGTTNADSQKLRNVQTQGSTMAAQASGAAISGAVDNAIGDAFGNGGSPVSMGPNGMTLNFTADPRADASSRAPFAARTDDALSALGYAAARNVTKAAPMAPVFEQRWSAWLDVRGSGWDKSHVVDGNQINVTGGLGYKVTPNVLVGVFGGYENFSYDFAALGGKLKGDGGTIGGYAAWKIAPTLRWDAMLGWSSIAYDASAGTASGNFDGSRWLLSTGLTGFYRYAAYIIEPSAKVFALWERQDAWSDSLGTLQDERSFSTGRLSLGGRVIAPSQHSTFTLSPYLGFYGDWRFSSDDALPVDVANAGLIDGWSGRVTGGMSLSAPGGGALSLGGEYGGIGAGYGVWTANARLHRPF